MINQPCRRCVRRRAPAVIERPGYGTGTGSADNVATRTFVLRREVVGLPLPRDASDRIGLAVDVSNRLRPDAARHCPVGA
jgi:hypothetical protein